MASSICLLLRLQWGGIQIHVGGGTAEFRHVIATRRQFLFLAGGFLLAGAGFSARAQKSEETSAARLMDDLMWNRSPIGGPFALIDHTGKPRADKDFRGKLLLIYFGYSYCPDVCPTDLQQIGLAVDRLGPEGEAVQPLFITLEPERDTAANLADYVPLFHPQAQGPHVKKRPT